MKTSRGFRVCVCIGMAALSIANYLTGGWALNVIGNAFVSGMYFMLALDDD